MRSPIPPGNRTNAKPVLARWFEQTERMLRGLWWIEQLALADEIPAFMVHEVRAALLGVLETLDERERREAHEAKIEQLERVEGRTPEEAALYLQKAQRMREAQTPKRGQTRTEESG